MGRLTRDKLAWISTYIAGVSICFVGVSIYTYKFKTEMRVHGQPYQKTG